LTEHVFRVRWYQQAFHHALVNRTHDRLIAIWHRRAGKDEIVLNAIRELSQKEPGTYWHCFPEYAQARKAIWQGVNGHTGKRRIDEIFPPSIRKRMVDNDMFIEFNNGATLQFLGSDRYDATVGAGPRFIAYSEWALCNPSAWAYHSPMIRETGGAAAFITTPRGNNHAKKMYERGLKSDRWFAERLSIEDTNALSEEMLAEALEEYQDVHGTDFGRSLYEQEYLVSWAGAMIGAYFGAEVSKAEREGRVKDVPIDTAHPVHCCMDLGKTSNNPVWLFQVIAGQLRIVDFYMPESDDLDDWCIDLRNRGFSGNCYVPHDIMVTEWGSKKTRMDRLIDRKMNPKRIARVSVADGLQAGRMAINNAVFDADNCELGIDGLKNYRREWDDELKTFRENPVKDWAEHIGSAWRYLGLAWKEAKPPKKEKKKPAELVYQVRPDGSVQANMSVREAVDAMVRRKRMQDD
jgi:phage terminase large subunit